MPLRYFASYIVSSVIMPVFPSHCTYCEFCHVHIGRMRRQPRLKPFWFLKLVSSEHGLSSWYTLCIVEPKVILSEWIILGDNIYFICL
jgi:hypothetical protein